MPQALGSIMVIQKMLKEKETLPYSVPKESAKQLVLASG